MAQQIRTTGSTTNSKSRSTGWILALAAVLVVGAIGTFVYLRKQKPAKMNQNPPPGGQSDSYELAINLSDNAGGNCPATTSK